MHKFILKEDRKHGKSIFPIHVYHDNPINKHITLDLHWHDELEFLIVRSGSMVLEIEGIKYTISEDEAAFINSGELHGGYCEGQHCLFDAIVFRPTLLYSNSFDLLQEKYIDPLINKKYTLKDPIIRPQTKSECKILSIIRQMIDGEKIRIPGYEMVLKSSLFTIITEFYTSGRIQMDNNYQKANYKIERVKAIIEFIEQETHRELTIEELANKFNMSKGYFCRFFKSLTRKTPIEYINTYRVNEAAKLLCETDITIAQIAFDVGFNNIGNFIANFKKIMKCTPSEYRQMSHTIGTTESII